MQGRVPASVTVAFDSHGGRLVRTFRDFIAAQRFWVRMKKAGRRPDVVGVA